MAINKNIWNIVALLLCLFPLLFPVANTTDWGSDFALYIHQAKNIVLGIPQTDNGFIMNSPCFEISAQAYSIGFPLILSPVYALFGLDISMYVYLQTFILGALGYVLFLTFKQRMGIIPALIAITFLIYSPYVMWYRNNILSEFSYILFQSLFLLIYLFGDRKKHWLLLGILLGIAFSIRSNAITIVLGIALFELFKNWELRRIYHLVSFNFKRLMLIGKIFSSAAIVYIILNKGLFNTGDNLSFFKRIYLEKGSLNYLLDNIYYYLTQIYESFFIYWHIEWFGFVGLITFILFFVFGMGKLQGRERVISYILVIQFMMVISFPFQQGMRYILPLMPLILYIVIKGSKVAWERFPYSKLIIVLVVTSFLYSEAQGVHRLNGYTKVERSWSPYTPETLKAWEYIKDNTSDSAIFVTAFPRVLTLYTDRPAYNPCTIDPNGILEGIDTKGASYIYVNTQTNKWVPTLEAFISTHNSILDTVYSNEEVTIFAINTNMPIK